jgi:hypothetical protein
MTDLPLAQHLPGYELDKPPTPDPAPDHPPLDPLPLLTMTTPLKIKVAQPDLFDGIPTKFADWQLQITLLMLAQGELSGPQKVIIALSYMKGGIAGPWAKKYLKQNLNKQDPDTGRPIPLDWDIFDAEMQTMFTDRMA